MNINTILRFFILLGRFYTSVGFTKVIVPAIYDEYVNRSLPFWISNKTYQEEFNYTVFLYQKLDKSKPLYLPSNRGCENGAYYKYIIDHYDNFPDVAMFVHAKPHEHQPNFLHLFHCINANATYMSINFPLKMCRSTENWSKYETWVEQCWRQTLKVVWNLQNDTKELNLRVPITKPILVCFYASQQFIISRDMIRKRPLNLWKELYHMLGNDEVCVHGEPDYSNLYAFQKNGKKIGPETSDIEEEHEGLKFKRKGWGRHTQAGASEHLSHVIFGHHELDMTYPSMREICQNFLPNCPFSPCVM